MKTTIAEHLAGHGFRPRVKDPTPRRRKDTSAADQMFAPYEPELIDQALAWPPAFAARVQDARLRLAAGEDPAEIRHEHGGVVMRAAREKRSLRIAQ